MNRRISTEVHEHLLLSLFARSWAARSSRRGRRAHRCRSRRARRGGRRLVTLSPSFMPRLLTRVPPLLSDLVPCDTARRRFRSGDRLIDISARRHRRRCRSGHRRRRGAAAWGLWLHAATSAKPDAIISGLPNLTIALSQSGRNHSAHDNAALRSTKREDFCRGKFLSRSGSLENSGPSI